MTQHEKTINQIKKRFREVERSGKFATKKEIEKVIAPEFGLTEGAIRNYLWKKS